MLQITTAQAINRLHTLPKELEDAIFDASSADVIDEIGKNNNLIDEQIYEVAKLTGWTMLGFLHPGDIASELQDRIAIEEKAAKNVAKQLNAKLFAPHKEAINRIYAPPEKTDEPEAKEKEQESAVTDIEKQAPSVRVMPKAPEKPTGDTTEVAKQIPVNGAGKPSEQKTRPKQTQEAPSSPKTQAPAPPKPDTKTEPGRTEQAPTQPTDEAPPKPFMLSDTSQSRTQSKKDDFKLKIDDALFGKKQPAPPPTPSARLEIGKKEQPDSPAKSQTSPKPRVVHYSDRRTPLSPKKEKVEKAPPAIPGDESAKEQHPAKPGASGPPTPPKPTGAKDSEQTPPAPPQSSQPPTPPENSDSQKSNNKEEKGETINLEDLG